MLVRWVTGRPRTRRPRPRKAIWFPRRRVVLGLNSSFGYFEVLSEERLFRGRVRLPAPTAVGLASEAALQVGWRFQLDRSEQKNDIWSYQSIGQTNLRPELMARTLAPNARVFLRSRFVL
jgi:hypothetical protein